MGDVYGRASGDVTPALAQRKSEREIDNMYYRSCFCRRLRTVSRVRRLVMVRSDTAVSRRGNCPPNKRRFKEVHLFLFAPGVHEECAFDEKAQISKAFAWSHAGDGFGGMDPF